MRDGLRILQCWYLAMISYIIGPTSSPSAGHDVWVVQNSRVVFPKEQGQALMNGFARNTLAPRTVHDTATQGTVTHAVNGLVTVTLPDDEAPYHVILSSDPAWTATLLSLEAKDFRKREEELSGRHFSWQEADSDASPATSERCAVLDSAGLDAALGVYRPELSSSTSLAFSAGGAGAFTIAWDVAASGDADAVARSFDLSLAVYAGLCFWRREPGARCGTTFSSAGLNDDDDYGHAGVQFQTGHGRFSQLLLQLCCLRVDNNGTFDALCNGRA